MAAEAIRTNPEARRRVEQAFGVERCRERYPEAYVEPKIRFWGGLKGLLGRI
jgi:hypothetical protein